jgi:heterodisulfide reductase subunit C
VGPTSASAADALSTLEEHTVPEAPSSHRGHEAPESLGAALARLTGLNPAKCYQCGKCTAGCPMAAEMPLKTHQMMRLVQLDRVERLLEDDSPWLCLGCETCTSRCPNGFDPARMVDGVRELGADRGVRGPRRIAAFHRAFLGQIRSHGRLFELGLVVDYKLHTGAFFDDVMEAPAMLKNGKLALLPESISKEGRLELERIFAGTADQAGRKAEQEGGR